MKATVASEWAMYCPECGSDIGLDIVARVSVRLTPDGTDADGTHEWDDESPCTCTECDHHGTVADFRHGYPDDPENRAAIVKAEGA
jgi:hypothetical protein